jgi:hypothetical protein
VRSDLGERLLARRSRGFAVTEEDGGSTPPAPTVSALTSLFVLDLQRLFTRAKVVWADGHCNYGNVFASFEERYGADLDGRSTLLVTGDARNNYRDPGLEVPTPQFTWARWLGKSLVTMSWQLHQRPGAPRG